MDCTIGYAIAKCFIIQIPQFLATSAASAKASMFDRNCIVTITKCLEQGLNPCFSQWEVLGRSFTRGSYQKPVFINPDLLPWTRAPRSKDLLDRIPRLIEEYP